MKSIALFVLLAVHSTTAFIFGSSSKWGGLRASFGVNPLTSFLSLPRTTSEAKKDGWKQDTSVGCMSMWKKFNGDRYIKDSDPGAMLLYDVNGYIAGIQEGIPKYSKYNYPAPQNRKYHVFNEEKDMYVVTAYFVDPAKICSKGRSKKEFEDQGTGDMLSFQTGPSAANLMKIPIDEKQALSKTKFVEGKCFLAMGKHYWYNTSENMSCDDMFPAFLLYNRGKLAGFGWAFNPNFSNSKRWEHPDRKKFSLFMKEVPKCLGKDAPVSTLHVYLTDSPRTNLC